MAFVAPTEAVAWYWLNPDFLWNGDRLAFVKTYIKKGGALTDPRQQALPLEDSFEGSLKSADATSSNF